MDFEMRDYNDIDSRERLWDFTIKDGSFKPIDHNEADYQRAIVATYLQRGTVPQAPTLGNQWVECLTGDVTPQALNAQVRDSIMNLTGELKYLPKYSMSDGKLLVEVKEV